MVCPAVDVTEAQALKHLLGAPSNAYNSQLTNPFPLAGMVDGVLVHHTRASDSDIRFPSNTVCLFESNVDIPLGVGGEPAPGKEKAYQRHNGGANYVFVDGHLKWYRREQVGPAGCPPGNIGAGPTFAAYSFVP